MAATSSVPVPDHADEPATTRELAELHAALQAAQAAAVHAHAEAEAARELNRRLLIQIANSPGEGDLAALRARAALVDEMEATRVWRWAARPRAVYGALRRRRRG